MNVMNQLVQNNYDVIESWGVVIADKIWGQGGVAIQQLSNVIFNL